MPKRSLQILIYVSFAAGIAAAQAPASAPAYSAADYASHIKRITAGKASSERGAAIRSELAKLNIRVATTGFVQKNRAGTLIEGTNIFGEVPSSDAKRTVMIGAHLDRVAVGTGAVDNASGSAAVIELVRAFAARPMKNVRLIGAFWDKEEAGLIGSRTHVESAKEKGLPDVYINFDVFGYGDTLWLWTPDSEGEFVKAISATATAAKFPLRSGPQYPPSDHLSFNVPGVASYSFSLVSGAEIDAMLKLLSGTQLARADFPKVLQTIHTPEDTADKIDAAAVTKALPIIEAAIRELDK